MKFSTAEEITPEVIEQIGFIDQVVRTLAGELDKNDYGSVQELIVGLNCINPELLGRSSDLATGTVIQKKYISTKKFLTFKIKLNYFELRNSSRETSAGVFKKALLLSRPEIEELHIKGFDTEKFYSDVRNILEQPSVEQGNSNSFFIYQPSKKERTEFLESEKLPLELFWDMIEGARASSHNNIPKQIQLITNSLSRKEESEIIGFECTLRELLVKANHYNVMAIQKIIEGRVDDDSFLYFRCKLILYGRLIFDLAIRDPNLIQTTIDPDENGEWLLSVADRAFILKFGEGHNKILPRDYAFEVIDYDSSDYPMLGEEWAETDLKKRYPALWYSYRR